MTLISEHDLDILQMYPHTENKDFQKLEHEQDRQTDRQTHSQTDRRDRTHYPENYYNLRRDDVHDF